MSTYWETEMGEVVRNGNLTESESSSVSLFFPISLLLPYPPKQPFWQLQGMLFIQAWSQPNPWAGWAACTLLKNNCFKIFTQKTRSYSQMTPNHCFPSPGGHKAAGWCRAGLCSCVFTASHSGLRQLIAEPCSCPVLAHWWPVDTQSFPALKGVWHPWWG